MSLQKEEKLRLEIFAEEIRRTAMQAVAGFGEGHIGGVLSAADLMAALYGRYLRIDPNNPQMADRDKVVMSKGHCGPVLYATLALKGYFPMELLKTMNRFGTNLPSHCDRLKTPGIDMSTGSLGQGASSAAGIALADQIQGRDCHTCLLLGDGECNEGQVWEMVMFAAQRKLNRLIAFVDRNHQQLDGWTDDICRMGNLADIFSSFGWHAVQIDGNNMDEICEAVDFAWSYEDAPCVIVLDTVKGKGWTEAENRVPCHYMTISQQQLSEYEAVSAQRIAALEKELGKVGQK